MKIGRGKNIHLEWSLAVTLHLCLFSTERKKCILFHFYEKVHFWEDETLQKSSETTQKNSKCLTGKSLKSFFNSTLLQYSFYLNILSVHFTNFQAVIMLPDWQCPAEPGSSGASLCQPQYKTQWHTFYLPQIASNSSSWDTWLMCDSTVTAVSQALLQRCCHDFTHGFEVIFINSMHKGFILKRIRHLKSLQPLTFQETPRYPGSRLFSLQHSTLRASVLSSPLEAV